MTHSLRNYKWSYHSLTYFPVLEMMLFRGFNILIIHYDWFVLGLRWHLICAGRTRVFQTVSGLWMLTSLRFLTDQSPQSVTTAASRNSKTSPSKFNSLLRCHHITMDQLCHHPYIEHQDAYFIPLRENYICSALIYHIGMGKKTLEILLELVNLKIRFPPVLCQISICCVWSAVGFYFPIPCGRNRKLIQIIFQD